MTRRAVKPKQSGAVPPGDRNGPEAVTKQKAGYITADAHGTKVLVVALAAEVRGNRR